MEMAKGATSVPLLRPLQVTSLLKLPLQPKQLLATSSKRPQRAKRGQVAEVVKGAFRRADCSKNRAKAAASCILGHGHKRQMRSVYFALGVSFEFPQRTERSEDKNEFYRF